MSAESPIQSPLDISEDLAPIPPQNLAADVRLSFSGLLDPPLVLREDLKDGCGGRTWPAGTLLARFLLAKKEELRGKAILELGAGGGLVGIALALGMHQGRLAQTQQDIPVLITDLPVLLPLQTQNIALNGLSPSTIISQALPWGESLPDTIPEVYKRPDIILAADCVYFEPAFPLLMSTLRELFGIDNDCPNKRSPTCWFCMKKRRRADLHFVKSLRKIFSVREIEVEREDDEKGTMLYEIRPRR